MFEKYLYTILAMITLVCSFIVPYALVLGIGFIGLEIWKLELARRQDVKTDGCKEIDAEVRAMMKELNWNVIEERVNRCELISQALSSGGKQSWV